MLDGLKVEKFTKLRVQNRQLQWQVPVLMTLEADEHTNTINLLTNYITYSRFLPSINNSFRIKTTEVERQTSSSPVLRLNFHKKKTFFLELFQNFQHLPLHCVWNLWWKSWTAPYCFPQIFASSLNIVLLSLKKTESHERGHEMINLFVLLQSLILCTRFAVQKGNLAGKLDIKFVSNLKLILNVQIIFIRFLWWLLHAFGTQPH